MVSLAFLDKEKKEEYLPQLFDLMYENMSGIAPSGRSYEQDRRLWLEEVSPALEKAPRQILLCFGNDKLIGYLQYYIRGDLLMLEELQFDRAFHSTALLCVAGRFFLRQLPPNIAWVEAYADRRNIHSRKLMEKSGMAELAEEDVRYVHLRGSVGNIKRLFRVE